MNKAAQTEASLARLIGLLGLMRKARMVSEPTAFAFLAVNETHLITHYRQAALWRSYGGVAAPGKGYIEAVSGLAIPDQNAPYILWLSQVLEHLARASATSANTSGKGKKEPHNKTPETWPGESIVLSQEQALRILPTHLGEEWHNWLPGYALWLPLTCFRGNKTTALSLGGLFLTRETPWPPEERQLLEELAGTYALVWQNLLSRNHFFGRITSLLQGGPIGLGRAMMWLFLFLALGSLFVPVRQSVLAPAVVVAANPVLVRSPLAGIIDRFHVTPNQVVKQKQLLLNLEDTQWRNQLETAKKEQEVAAAEYRQAVQKATRDPRRTTQSILQKKRLEQKKADVLFLQERLKQVEIRATRHGIAVFADVNDWIGRPVKVGERILMLADPKQVELEVHLPVADAINLEVGAKVAMFLNIHPGAPLPAVLEYASYQAEITTEGILAYRIKAHFTDLERTPRIGLAGFARIYHKRIPLWKLLIRRPLAVARRWLGF